MQKYENPQPNESEKKPMTPNTIEWEPSLDVSSPIEGKDIPGFKAWINWNDADIDRIGSRKGYHSGVDFAAYLNMEDEIVFGLPPNTPVRAVAD